MSRQSIIWTLAGPVLFTENGNRQSILGGSIVSEANGATSVTVALTGNSATGSVGTVVYGVPLIGNAGTGTVGTGTPSITVALTGNAATGAVGTVVYGVPLTGNAGTGSVGSLVPVTATTGNAATGSTGTATPSTTVGITGNSAIGAVGNATVAIVPAGVVGTGSAGTATPSTTVGITGVAAIGAVGSIVVTTALTGNTATGSTGTATPNTTVGITGNSATGSVGSIVVTSALIGNSATGTAGSVTPTNAVTGDTGTGTIGGTTPATTVTPVGVAGTSAVGTTTPSITIGLTGVSCTGMAGLVHLTSDIIQPITGAGAASSVGSVVYGLSAALPGDAATSSVGTTTPSNALPVTGNTSTGAVGSVVQSRSIPTIGDSATGVAGIAAPGTTAGVTGNISTGSVGVVHVTVGLSGVFATSFAGSAAHQTAVLLSKVSGKTSVGSVGVYNPTSVRASGGDVFVTRITEEVFMVKKVVHVHIHIDQHFGDIVLAPGYKLNPSVILVPITGNAAAAVAGNVTSPASPVVGITGNGAIGAAGTMKTPNPNIQLTGNQANADVGTMRASNPNVAITGNQAIGTVGIASAPNTGISITTLTIANTSGVTVPGGFITQMFGHQFKQGDIPVGFRPRFETTATFECPHTMFGESLWPDGSLKTASFFARVPGLVAGNGSINLVVKATQAAQPASSRTLADFASGGADIKMSVVGLDNLSGTWESSLNMGTAGAMVLGDGPVGKVWRIWQPFTQAGVPHGQLMALWYAVALQDASGNLYGVRYLARVCQPSYNLDTPVKSFRSFSSMQVKNGASVVRDCYANHAAPKSFTYSSGNTVSCPAHTLEVGTLVRLSGALPAGVTAGTSYFLGVPDNNSLGFANVPNNNSSNFAALSGGSTSGSLVAYPYLTHFGSLWSAGSSAMYDFAQAGGSAAADAPVRVVKNKKYMVSTGLVGSYDVTTVPTAQTAWGYEPNSMGPIQRDNTGTGERPDIGLFPTWHVRHIMSGNAVDEQVVRATGLMLAHAPIQLLDAATKMMPIVNNKTYAGMPASNQNFRWDGGNNTSGFTNPAGIKATGLFAVTFDHMPCLWTYPYLMTGEPQFLDMGLDMMNLAVMHRYNGPSTSNAISIGVIRNGTCNGTVYSGVTAGDPYALREDAWSSRDVGMVNGLMPTSQNASVKAYAADLMDATYSILIDYINNVAPPFFKASGMMHHRTATYAQNSDNWMHGYWLAQNSYVAAVTQNAKVRTLMDHAMKWFVVQYNIVNSAWHLPTYRTIARVGDSSTAPYITTTTQLASTGGAISWTAAGSLFTAQVTPSGNGWNPANGDKIMWETEFGSPVPAGMARFTPYYAVNTSGRTFQLSLSPGGAPLTLSDSFATPVGICLISANPPAQYGMEGGIGYQLGYLANIHGACNLAKAAGCTTYSQAMINDLNTRDTGAAFNTDPKWSMVDSYNQ